MQNKAMKWMSDIEIVVGTQTIWSINPTRSIATKKWHGSFNHPKAIIVVSTAVDEETVGAVDITTKDAPVVTALAFKAKRLGCRAVIAQ